MGRGAETHPQRLIIGLACAVALAACHRPPDAASAPKPKAAVANTATAQPVNPDPGVRTYVCENGERIEAGYPDARSAMIRYRGRPYPLTAAMAASGVRYVGYGLQWWTKGMGEARLSTLKPGEEAASDPGVLCRTEAPAHSAGQSAAPDPASPEAAAETTRRFFDALQSGRSDELAPLWTDPVRTGPGSLSEFRASLEAYRTYRLEMRAPGPMQGAAGSSYIEMPFSLQGRLKSGSESRTQGTVVLRRVNDVPGSTPEQRRWRIERIDVARAE